MECNVGNRERLQRVLRGAARSGAAAGLLLGTALTLQAAAAGAVEPALCVREDAKLTATGKGDRDFDGLSDCREKKVVGTMPRDPDSDDDGVGDGDEVGAGTNPVDADSDDDGLSDGREHEIDCDPLDVDSDDDGTEDGSDLDPAQELDREIEGELDALTCPGEENGSMQVMGIEIALTADTRFEGVTDCADLAGRFASQDGAHAEVRVQGELGSFVAERVELDDHDHDGSPDGVDDDDDSGEHDDD